jgi:hypothetical protein
MIKTNRRCRDEQYTSVVFNQVIDKICIGDLQLLVERSASLKLNFSPNYFRLGMHRSGASRTRSFPKLKILCSAILVICTQQSILFVTFGQIAKMTEPGNSRSGNIPSLIVLNQGL